MIRPLNDQLLIRPLEAEDAPGALVVMPPSAKKTTVQGSDGSRINYVLAEVVAVGPGRRRVDADLLPDMTMFLSDVIHECEQVANGYAPDGFVLVRARELITRAAATERVPLEVSPGDRILYHPSVANFDREIYLEGVRHWIIGSHSLLAVVGARRASAA